MVRNNLSKQVDWILSTRANIPPKFDVPPADHVIVTPSPNTNANLTHTLVAPLQTSNLANNAVEASHLENARRKTGLQRTPVPITRSFSGLENVEPTRRSSSLTIMTRNTTRPVSTPQAQQQVPNEKVTVPLRESVNKGTTSKLSQPPTVVDLTDDLEDGENEEFFDTSDQLEVNDVLNNKRTNGDLIIQSNSKRQKVVPAPLADIFSKSDDEFNDDMDLDGHLEQTVVPPRQNNPILNQSKQEGLQQSLLELQKLYIKLCEQKISLLEQKIDIIESTALSEDMKKIEKEKLNPNIMNISERTVDLKRRISTLENDSARDTVFRTPVKPASRLSNLQSNAPILPSISNNAFPEITLSSDLEFTHDEEVEAEVLPLLEEVPDSSDLDEPITILQVTQNANRRQRDRTHNIPTTEFPGPDHEEEDNFGGEYTNQGLETDNEEVQPMSTQEERELREFIVDDDLEADMSYKDEEEDEEEEDAEDEAEQVNQDDKIGSDEDIVDSLQDLTHHDNEIEEISSDEELYGDDGFKSQYDMEREVDLIKIEDDLIDSDDDIMMELASKKPTVTTTSDPLSNHLPSSPREILDEVEIQEIEIFQKDAAEFRGQEFPWTNEVYNVLRGKFGLTSFRSNQEEAVNCTLSGLDVFVLMPTGGGKSLCYQLPALIKSGKTHGTTIVISPLISLMQDQVAHLHKNNIRAGMINSKANAEERKHMFNLFRDGLLDLVYLSPEMIGASTRVKNVIEHLFQSGKLARVVVDEAHCVSSWGHDFRPDYKNLSYFKSSFPSIPMMALTATANEHVRMDILHNLGITGAKLFKQSFNRTNLFYKVLIKDKTVYEKITELMNHKYRNQSGIIYCHSKLSCEQTSDRLILEGVRCAFYHAGMSPEDRLDTQVRWQAGELQVICATIAFGMGIDKPDVRIVIHLTIPRTLEGYYQETGRAGRDGKESECIMFFSYRDARTLQGMIQKDKELDRLGKEKHLNKLRQVLQYCDNKTDCRRQQVLQYFNEKFDKLDCKKKCDNCCTKIAMVERDVTEYAKDMIKLVLSIQDSTVTLLHCQDVFKGSKSAKVVNLGHHEIPYHGKGRDLDKGTIERIFFHLISQQILEEYSVMNTAGFASNYIRVGKEANLVLMRNRKIVIAFNEQSNKAPSTSTSINNTTANRRTTSDQSKNNYNTGAIPAHFTQASSELRRQLSFQNTTPIVLSRSEYSLEQEQFINRCCNMLNEVRMRKMSELNYNITSQFVPDAILREMLITLPTTAKDFKKLKGMTLKILGHFMAFKPTLIKLNKEKNSGNFSMPLEIPTSSFQTQQSNAEDEVMAQLKLISSNSQVSSTSARSSQRKTPYRGRYKRGSSSQRGNYSQGGRKSYSNGRARSNGNARAKTHVSAKAMPI